MNLGGGVLRPASLHRPRAHPWLIALAVALAAPASWAAPATNPNTSCTRALGVPAVSAGPVRTLGTEAATVDLTLSPGETYLIEVPERDNDALVEVLGPKAEVLAESDHPERRTGTRRAIVTAPGTGHVTVRVIGREEVGIAGKATVRAFDLARLRARSDCLLVVKALAAADSDYAAGQAISRGHTTSLAGSARDWFLKSADSYLAAEQALVASGDRSLRGQTQFALAEVEYIDLQDWSKAADWAQTAAATLGTSDLYRQARAQTLLAEAWIEIGRRAPADRPVPGYGVPSSDLLDRARSMFQRLSRFHLRRGEMYDAGVQITNIGVTYVYQGRFADCVRVTQASSRLFESIHETTRRVQAQQDGALCLWGLGRLPEARRWFRRALSEVRPEPDPILYRGVINNTALADYTAGDFDESLRLFDRALNFARQTQARRDEGQSLYGIGLNYYALGDSARAREFLGHSLEIRTVALDRRGRMATLRALATVDADDGRLGEAIANEREALTLAIAPASVERITIQLAVDAATSGHLDDAKAQLDTVLANTQVTDPAIRAEALLQRAVLLRKMGHFQQALADLAVARPNLHKLGNSAEEFAANLELARTWRSVGEPRQALSAVDAALGQADAVRLQSANPEFRLQLQTPLRAAYDLKIELLRARYDDALAAGRTSEADELAAAAFITADASRARSLADVATQEYSSAVRRELAPQLRRRESLYKELAGREFTLESHLEFAGSGDARSHQLKSDIAEIERQLDTINTLIASRAGSDARRAPADRDRASLPRVPAETALIAYWLGTESAYAWVILPDGIHWTRLSPPGDITDLATAFYRSLTRMVDVPVAGRVDASRALSAKILSPIGRWVAAAPQWVVIPDGALDYVPFAALRTPAGNSDAFLVLRHDVATTPAAWMLDPSGDRREQSAPRKLLLVADPVYQGDDPRLASLPASATAIPTSERSTPDPARRDLQRLPFTAQEAAGIAAEFPAGAVDELTGLEATRERVLSLDWSKYSFIHIATHGIVDAQVPELSALILGSYDARGDPVVDNAIRVADLSLLTLRADVAVFSGCDTALGRRAPSEGLVGISSTVLARGAKAVVASLWPVSDEIGARLMTDFYRHVLHDSMSAPMALGASMRSIVSRSGSADPALWAAFQVSVVALGPGLPIRDTRTASTATIARPEETP